MKLFWIVLWAAYLMFWVIDIFTHSPDHTSDMAMATAALAMYYIWDDKEKRA